MTRFLNTKWGMRKKLLCYMLLLAMLLLFALFSGILMIGRFDSAEKDIKQSLEIQMEVFEKDMASYFESLAANSIDLSRYMTDFIEHDSEISGKSFQSLNNNPDKIEQVQKDLIIPLAQKLQTQNCSGIFVMLNATVNSSVEYADFSRTGLYLQHNRYHNDENIILFRGISSVSKAQNIMPHRKWRLEFRTDQFPNYEQIASNANLPLEQAYQLTDCTTLSGTSDDVVLMAVPITGNDGTFYGICGYEVSADYFVTYHTQPTKEKRLACMLLTANVQNTYQPAGLSCSGPNSHVQTPETMVTLKPSGSLSEISDGNLSFMGVNTEITLTPNNEPYTLTVMMPKSDYNNAVVKGMIQLVILIVLLLFFAISCCLFFSQRYLSPILKGLEQIKQKTWESDDSSIPEISDLFAYLARQDEETQKKYDQAQTELEQAQLELQRLSYSRKSEIDPDQYQLFLSGLKTLTAMEKKIFNYYMEGHSVKEIIELAGVKESTIRFHNRNIYSKLNVNSLKQLLLYASMVKQTEETEAGL